MSAFVRQGLDWPVRRILRINWDPATGEEKAIVDWEPSAVPIKDIDPVIVDAFKNNTAQPAHCSFFVEMRALRTIDPRFPSKLVKFVDDVIRPKQEGVVRLRAHVNGDDDVIVEWSAGKFSPK